MEVYVSRVPPSCTVHKLKGHIAVVLHSPPFLNPTDTKFNFELFLIPQRRPGQWRNAALTLPTVEIGRAFLRLYGDPNPECRIALGPLSLQFRESSKEARKEVVERVLRLPYEDPVVAEEQEEQKAAPTHPVRISTLQFGWECRDQVYSVEWEKTCDGDLSFDGDKREFRVRVPPVGLGGDVRMVAIRASQIAWVSASLHRASRRPVIFFSLNYPPSFESESTFAGMLYAVSGKNQMPLRQRWSYFDESHEAIAPYTSLAIRLECTSLDDLDTFRGFARAAHIQVSSDPYPIEYRSLFSDTHRQEYELWAAVLPWIVAFHIEALLRLWLVDMREVLTLRDPINRILRARPQGYTVERQREYTAALLRDFAKQAQLLFWYGDGEHRANSAASQRSHESIAELFAQVQSEFVYKPIDTSAPSDGLATPFNCLHLAVTPTTMCLEGPYPERSNRVMRRYWRNQDCFLRVCFQDENRLQFRFDREVDGRSFINRRVKGLLLNGITIARAHFDFLAYSQSALKEHAVWFVKPFRHRDDNGDVYIVDASTIIASLGDFRVAYDPTLIRCPARYAARISQAFTATDASVSMEVGQISKDADIKDTSGQYAFTDGVGTMSVQVAKDIWRKLREARRRGKKDKTYPRAYQIRFQGSKGMLSVDHTLPGNAILLRPSMTKFEDRNSTTIEIARAFDKPSLYYLNRPLIMLLEGLGVPYEVFKKLQDAAVHEAQNAVESLERSARLLEGHGLGASFRLTSTFLGLHKLGLGSPNDDIFWRQMMDFAVNHVLRELKHHARIPVRSNDSWTLVGVADVHGYLREGEVFVCVDSPNVSGLIYLEGPVLVSRSPTIHPGDVQIVHAIGRPPYDSPFAKESLRNTIVFSIRGARPLPSMLGGGDLDGDVYNVTTRSDLLPRVTCQPASYEPAERRLVDHDCTIEDIAEFVAEYISSDTLGIIATTWLIIADQSEKGIHDEDCLSLAELHSNAVDYPKSGKPVPLERIPRLKFKIKPDWNAPETFREGDGRYYESKRAIGKLYRSIDLPALRKVEGAVRFQRKHMGHGNQDEQFADVVRQFHEMELDDDDEVALTVQDRVAEFITPDDYDDDDIINIWELYNSYVSQLRAICADYTLSHARSGMLSEEEVVVGTIVAKCSQPRKRKDLMAQMREQASTLVTSVRDEIAGDEGVPFQISLQRAWTAYRLAIMEGDTFGARSFAWVVLGNVFDAIKDIEEEERSMSRRG